MFLIIDLNIIIDMNNISIIVFKLINLILLLPRIIRFFYEFPQPTKLVNNIINNIINNKSKKISISTWNVQGLFFYIYNRKEKTKEIIKNIKIMNTDIICLQEVFDDTLKEEIINNLKDIYPNHLHGNLNKKYVVGEDSGLLILSKYNIEFIDEEILLGAKLPDVFANKSSIFFKIENIVFCNVHIQSSEWSENRDLSKKQIERIINKYDNLILVGDLNSGDVYDYIKTKNKNMNLTCEGENLVLDYIISPNDKYHILSDTFYLDIAKCSDHYPVIGNIFL